MNVRKLERGFIRDVPGGWLHLASEDDASPQFMGYDPECNWCWLGCGHSAESHDVHIS